MHLADDRADFPIGEEKQKRLRQEPGASLLPDQGDGFSGYLRLRMD